MIQSRGWHVIDLLCWILSADWVIALLIRVSSQKAGNPADSSNRHMHIHIRMRAHTHTRSVELHPVVLANQGPYNWRCRVSVWAGDVDYKRCVCVPLVGRCLWWICNFLLIRLSYVNIHRCACKSHAENMAAVQGEAARWNWNTIFMEGEKG